MRQLINVAILLDNDNTISPYNDYTGKYEFGKPVCPA